MLLGVPVQLPGELLTSPEPTCTHGSDPAMCPLLCCSGRHIANSPGHGVFVYFRRGGSVSPLVPLFMGPCEILGKHAKTFVLRRGVKSKVVHIDHLNHTGSRPPASLFTSKGQASVLSECPACNLIGRRPGAPVETHMNVNFTASLILAICECACRESRQFATAEKTSILPTTILQNINEYSGTDFVFYML